MKIIKLADANFKEVVGQVKAVLEKDGLVVLPSDTAYGLAANAESHKAVTKIYDFKGRKFGKGISVFLNNLGEVGRYTMYSQQQEEVLKTLLPGSFTVILESKGRLSANLEPGDGTLGIRVIKHDLIRAVTQATGFPITATSANLAGKGPHFSVDSLLKTLSAKKKIMIDLVIDVGSLPRRPTSTLVRLVGEEVKVLREGALNLNLLLKLESKSEAETKKFGQRIFKDYLVKDLQEKAAVVIIKGDLGVGKTVFAKGIGELFKLQLTSPTYVLMNEYPVEPKTKDPRPETIYHLDLYRVENESEILELGLEQFLKKGNLILIEWGEKLSVFEGLKGKNTVFYLLQMNELSREKRSLNFYQL